MSLYLVLGLTAIPITAVVVFHLYKNLTLYNRALKTGHWNKVDGVLKYIEFPTLAEHEKGTFRVWTEYDYQVNGAPLSGNQSYIGSGCVNLTPTEFESFEKLSPGATVSVYVNPTNPRDTVLFNQLPELLRLRTLNFVGCFIVGLVFAIIVLVSQLMPKDHTVFPKEVTRESA